MRVIDWIKGKLDIHPDPARSFLAPEPQEDLEERPTEPVVSNRYKVTTKVKDNQGKEDKVLFVYGRDEAEARSRISESLLEGATIELAGHVRDGVVHFPPEELRLAMESMQDDRKAPGS
jgi:hypothetical protein